MSTASPVIVGSDRFLAITDACAPVSSAHLEQPYSSQTSAALFKDPPTKTHVVGYSHAHAGWAINRHAATLLAPNMGHWEDILKAPGTTPSSRSPSPSSPSSHSLTNIITMKIILYSNKQSQVFLL